MGPSTKSGWRVVTPRGPLSALLGARTNGPGAVETKPGSATVPFFGIESVILDPQTGKELEGNNVEGVLVIKKPWPSIARTIFRDHNRYLDTYMKTYPGDFYTGDGAARDKDGYIWIKGRVDGMFVKFWS